MNYAVKGQDASGLAFGNRKQTQPPDVAGDLARLVAKGVSVHVVAEDMTARGIGAGDVIDGLTLTSRSDLASLLARYDLIWHW